MLLLDPARNRLHLLDDGNDIVLLGWPTMRAFQRVAGPRPWIAFEPEDFRIDTGFSEDAEPASIETVLRFLAPTPQDLLDAVRAFGDGHWSLLAWLSLAGVPGRDLLHSNPALAYLVGRVAHVQEGGRAAHPTWSVRPYNTQRWLLSRLGFPGTDQMRRIFRKIEPAAVSVPRLTGLRDSIVQAPELQATLSHLPRINANALSAAAFGGVRVTPRLLTHLADGAGDDHAGAVGNLIADTVRGLRLLRPRATLPLFDTVAQVQQAHEHVIAQLSDYRHRARKPLPRPPIPGNVFIHPLATAADLVLEGRAQHNCVASYTAMVRRGEVAVYRVLQPERATLSLRRYGRSWAIDELKGPCNAPVTPQTQQWVQRWIDLAVRGEAAGGEGSTGPDAQ
jgi:hypothetical protein